jgi:uncharacterized OB-fold protein
MAGLPIPVPDTVSAFYWEAAGRGELAALRCSSCGLLHHPPDVACPHCGGTGLEPEALSGRGTVYASAVARQAFDTSFVDELPYVVALIELAEQPGLRVLANVIDVAPEAVAVGTPVEVAFERRGDVALPQFRLLEL